MKYVKNSPQLLLNINRKSHAIYRMVWFAITLNDPITRVSRSCYFVEVNVSKRCIYPTADQKIHLLNFQCNVPLMRGPSAISEPLVIIPLTAFYRITFLVCMSLCLCDDNSKVLDGCRWNLVLAHPCRWTKRNFYRAMHFSAKRGIAIACRLSVRLSVCLSVCNVGELW